MGHIMIEYDALRPTAFLVATLALLAFLSLVNVVGQVTAVALLAQFLFIEFAAMACRAVQFGMLTFERKLGVVVMDEACVLPALLCMAGVTLLAITPAVLVIVFMAAVAVFFGFYLIHRVFVTGFTNDLVVLAS